MELLLLRGEPPSAKVIVVRVVRTLLGGLRGDGEGRDVGCRGRAGHDSWLLDDVGNDVELVVNVKNESEEKRCCVQSQ